ncbi:glycosyltransferase family 39 protein [Variovorax sp. RHLX14]|uniref:glycosyltransferase family 39 protein n=1 Tax=Variovorax sp. RHLX14 TaxID=1259731 RepID=UPI003F45A18D
MRRRTNNAGDASRWPVSGHNTSHRIFLFLRATALAEIRRLPVAVWLGVWTVAWVLVLGALSWSPPMDSVEQLVWVRSLEWGYSKHPPLPTILIWPFVQLFGIHHAVVDVAGGVVIALSLWAAWRLVKEMAGTHFAALSLLGTLCITYYCGRTNFYNHNTVLLVFVAGAAWFCWRAFADRSRTAWLALGLMLGLGALAKYQVVLAALSVVMFWALKRGWRDSLHMRGLLEAAGVAALVFSPHLWWLFTHDFLPMHYASRSALVAVMPYMQRAAHALHWLADQCNRLSPALLLAAGVWWKTRAVTETDAALSSASSTHPDARRFLIAWGLLPLATIALIGVATGANLQFQWGTAFVLFTCPSLMLCCCKKCTIDNVPFDAVLRLFLVVQGLLLATMWATSPVSGFGWNKSQTSNFRSAHFAERIGAEARMALGGPVRVIGGAANIASALAIRLPERPLVLLDGDYVASPWVSAALVEREGMLWVGDVASKPPAGLVAIWESDNLWWAVQAPLEFKKASDATQATLSSKQVSLR